MPFLLRLGSLLVAINVLLACTTQPPAPSTATNWTQHRDAVAALSSWEFAGKVSIKTATSAENARLRWSQQPDKLRLEVSGPMGLQPFVLEREGSSLRVFRDKHWQSLATATGALEAELGWPLPLPLLSWWLRGLPDPAVAVTTRELSDGRLQTLEQDGWLLRYDAYAEVDGIKLPSRIRFQREDVSGKILLKRWTIEP
jgi:outer membrane lipoprotein LolB